MYSIRTVVNVEGGIHARPTVEIVGIAEKFSGDITLRNLKNGACAGANSPMEVILLGAVEGSEIEIEFNDKTGEEVAYRIAEYLNSGRRYSSEFKGN